VDSERRHQPAGGTVLRTDRSRRLDFDLTRPFLGREAIAAGLSPASLKSRKFRRLLGGVYLHASTPVHPVHRVQAALLIHPPVARASHLSAATVYGLPVPDRAEVHVTVPTPGDRRERHGIRCHVARDGDVVSLSGIRVSPPAQLFVELAGVLDLVELVVVGDALVRQKRLTPAELVAACTESSAKHAKAARRAASYVRAEVDSPMESRLRMLIVLAGLPEPQVNFTVYADGRLLYRFDLCYPELKLIVEYDGRQHRKDLDQWDHDVERHDWFDDEGWRIVPVFSRGIYREPGRTIERVLTALRARGCSTLPRALSDEWRAYFPARPR
jgi:very-short-patch-repair endonuclease